MNWKIQNKLSTLNSQLSTDEIIDLLLENRGLKTAKEKREFFNPINPTDITLKELEINPTEVAKATKRIERAIKNKEGILIYGDYDADGICATAILWETLYSFYKNVLPYIPGRFSEGYGINAHSVKDLKLKNKNLKLIITVDNGIVATKAIKEIKALGIDVIITDHHTPEKSLPKARAIIHTTKIGGAALAWIFSREVLKKLQPTTYNLQPVGGLELAAIGTISDQLPLVGVNRSIAKYGLSELNRSRRPGIEALLAESGIPKGSLGSYEVGFLIAPRLNAMGRLGNATESLRLLCTSDITKARTLAMLLNKTNLDRQKIVEEVVVHARNYIVNNTFKGIILLADESYHEGVIGLAAAKIVEEFWRPAIVISKKQEFSKGSARSIPGFNIIEAIRKLDKFLIDGGGHPMAAGFTIKTADLTLFTAGLKEVSDPFLTEDLLNKNLRIDTEINFDLINQDLADKIAEFAPTGLGNPAPTFLTKKVMIVDAKRVGSNLNHLKLRLRLNSKTFEAIAFNLGELFTQIKPDTTIDLVYNLEENIWNGNKSLQLKIKDMKII